MLSSAAITVDKQSTPKHKGKYLAHMIRLSNARHAQGTVARSTLDMLFGRRQREFAETTKGCTQYDGWLNFTLHGWAYTLSSHSPHPTVPQLHRVIIIIRCYCCFVRGNVSIETKWSKWLIWTNVRTEFSRVFFSFFTCKFMEFWFLQFSLWNNSRSLLYSQHSNCADCKWLTRQEKWRKKTI